MIAREDIEAETKIIWEEPPENFAYVRQSLELTRTRTGPVLYAQSGRRVGYAEVSRALRSDRPSGRIRRRVFWVLPHDRSEEPDGVYAQGVPLEGIDPLTVQPGIVGSITDRARGEGPASSTSAQAEAVPTNTESPRTRADTR